MRCVLLCSLIFPLACMLLAGNMLQAPHAQPHALGGGTDLMQGPAMSDEALHAAIRAHHPINRMQCGSWVAHYAQLHNDIRAGRAPQVCV